MKTNNANATKTIDDIINIDISFNFLANNKNPKENNVNKPIQEMIIVSKGSCLKNPWMPQLFGPKLSGPQCIPKRINISGRTISIKKTKNNNINIIVAGLLRNDFPDVSAIIFKYLNKYIKTFFKKFHKFLSKNSTKDRAYNNMINIIII
jgi:hypothetical protein